MSMRTFPLDRGFEGTEAKPQPNSSGRTFSPTPPPSGNKLPVSNGLCRLGMLAVHTSKSNG
ncbi:hypothetical protein GYMLUDRAFT_39295 [Collybiopsis luxurians FD-317 M1]|nr:hypothetical protein GYMLUDRAFT_39295 [Collybiopsis luxurians FD-317 M1]